MSARVLIVEDNPAIVTLVRDLLTLHGCEVQATWATDEVLRAVEQTPPDVILMDVDLPGQTDGLTLTRRIKQGRQPPSIVIFTASAMPEDRARALEAGCDEFLSKPLRMSDLLATIQRYLPAVVPTPGVEEELRPSRPAHPFAEQPSASPIPPLSPLVESANMFNLAATQSLEDLLEHWRDGGEDGFRILSRLEPPGLRRKAATALARAPQVIARLAEDPSSEARSLALAAIGCRTQVDEAQLTLLWAGLDAPTETVWRAASGALGRLAGRDPAVHRRVLEEATGSQGRLRLLPALAAICHGSDLARSLLAEARQGSDVALRAAALEALLEANQWPVLSVQAWATHLDDPSREVQMLAVSGLRLAAAGSQLAVDSLQACAAQAQHPARLRAVRALVEVSAANPQALVAVRGLLTDMDAVGRLAITLGLSRTLQSAPDVGVHLLADVVDGAEAEVRESAAQALEEASESVPAGVLVQALIAHRAGTGLLPELQAGGGRCGRLAATLLPLAEATDDALLESLSSWRQAVGEDVAVYAVLERLMRVATMDEVLVAAADVSLALTTAPRCLLPAFEELHAWIDQLSAFETETDPERQSAIVARAVEELEQWRSRRVAEGTPFRACLSQVATRCKALVVTTLLSARQGAHLTLSVKARQLVPGAASHVTLEVHNDGPGAAYGVLLEMAAEAGTTVQVGSHHLPSIPPGASPCVDFVFTSNAATVRGVFSARYSDFSQSDCVTSFVEEITHDTVSFRTIPNPYIPGLPLEVGSDLFLGREDIFKFVAQNLSGPRRLVVLTGQRRMGKTSLLKQLPLRLPSSVIPVFVDCQGLERHGLGNMLSHLAYIIGDVLAEEGVDVPVPDLASFSERPVFSFEQGFLKPVWAALGGRTLLLLIDEFQAFDEAVEAGELAPGHLGFLRSLMQHQDKLSFMFSGLQKPLEQARDYWQPVFNVALRREVGLLEANYARELIEKPVAGFVHFHAGAVDELIRLTCGHPYLTQLFCDRLVSRLNERRESVVRVQHVHEVIADVFAAGVNHFFSLWDDLSAREKIVLIGMSATLTHHQFATLSAVTRYLRERGITADLDELTTVLQQLLGHDIIHYANSNPPGYSFSVLLFRLWIEKEMLHALVGSSIKWT